MKHLKYFEMSLDDEYFIIGDYVIYTHRYREPGKIYKYMEIFCKIVDIGGKYISVENQKTGKKYVASLNNIRKATPEEISINIEANKFNL